MNSNLDIVIDSPQQKFVRSIRDPSRRKFAHEYIDWLAQGKCGALPDRGRLSAEAASLLVISIEAIG